MLNPISKGEAPVLVDQTLWPSDNGTFFAYGGAIPFSMGLEGQPDPPDNQLWEFTPDGNAGSWSQVSIDASSNFSSLVRTIDTTWGHSSDGLGFAVGGWVTAGVAQGTNDDEGYQYQVPGMVMYNSSSQQWYNISGATSSGYAPSGTTHFVPSFGPAGLLFVLGGYQGDEPMSFDWALMFEPLSQQWQYQKTTGDLPAQVKVPCAVGVEGNEGTYEVLKLCCAVDARAMKLTAICRSFCTEAMLLEGRLRP